MKYPSTVVGSNFKEIVKDREQMEQFHGFLEAQGCEVQLLFWLAMEDLKSTMTNTQVCSRKEERIIKHFFRDSETRRGEVYSIFTGYNIHTAHALPAQNVV